MKEQAIKLEITNSRNDNKSVEWFFCNTDEDKNRWIQEKNEEQEKWNYHTSGAMSTRYYYFNEYLIGDLLESFCRLALLPHRCLIEIINLII